MTKKKPNKDYGPDQPPPSPLIFKDSGPEQPPPVAFVDDPPVPAGVDASAPFFTGHEKPPADDLELPTEDGLTIYSDADASAYSDPSLPPDPCYFIDQQRSQVPSERTQEPPDLSFADEQQVPFNPSSPLSFVNDPWASPISPLRNPVKRKSDTKWDGEGIAPELDQEWAHTTEEEMEKILADLVISKGGPFDFDEGEDGEMSDADNQFVMRAIMDLRGLTFNDWVIGAPSELASQEAMTGLLEAENNQVLNSDEIQEPETQDPQDTQKSQVIQDPKLDEQVVEPAQEKAQKVSTGKLIDGVSKETNKETKAEMDFRELNRSITEDIMSKVVIKTFTTRVPFDKINKIFDKLAEMFGISKRAAMTAVYDLFLRGAANKNAPVTLVTTVEFEGVAAQIYKRDLVYIYELVTQNPHVRRLGETLGSEISIFAERRGLSGDLAKQINSRRLAKNLDPLSPRQKAWCSCFNQNNEVLSSDPELKLVAQELALDFQFKFERKKFNPTPPKNKKGEVKKKQQDKASQNITPRRSRKGGVATKKPSINPEKPKKEDNDFPAS